MDTKIVRGTVVVVATDIGNLKKPREKWSSKQFQSAVETISNHPRVVKLVSVNELNISYTKENREYVVDQLVRLAKAENIYVLFLTRSSFFLELKCPPWVFIPDLRNLMGNASWKRAKLREMSKRHLFSFIANKLETFLVHVYGDDYEVVA